MFNKKKCPRCKEKVNKDFDFCPNCGNAFNDNNQDWGMLGKNDFMQGQDPFENMFGGNMLNKMLGNAMKMLEKEMQKANMQDIQDMQPKTNFELIINGKRIDPKNIRVTRQPIRKPQNQPTKQMKKKEFSEASIKKLSKLPRQEPSTNVKRFSDKIVYEINVPGVKSIDDVSIIPLEESIEVKAIGKNKVYSKLIPLNLPIANYNLSKGKLILEFENKG